MRATGKVGQAGREDQGVEAAVEAEERERGEEQLEEAGGCSGPGTATAFHPLRPLRFCTLVSPFLAMGLPYRAHITPSTLLITLFLQVI